jgi:arginase
MFNITLSCCKAGQKKCGVDKGALILLDKIRNFINPNKTNLFEIITNNEFENNTGYQKLYNIMCNTNEIFLNLGGDHSIGLPSVMASLYKYGNNFKIIWVDAHADINTRETSLSGNTHGMPLSPVFNLMEPWIKLKNNHTFALPEQLIYIGLRSVDEKEREFIDKLGIKTYYNTDVQKIGIKNIMNDIIEQNPNKYFHLSFDIDGLDAKVMPSTGTAEENGLSLEDGIHIVERFVNSEKLVTYDLVEFNPEIGTEEEKNITLDNCEKLLLPFLKKYQ